MKKSDREQKYKHSNYGWFSLTKKETDHGTYGSGYYSTPHGIVGIYYDFNHTRQQLHVSLDFVWKGYKHNSFYNDIMPATDRQIKIFATKFANDVVAKN